MSRTVGDITRNRKEVYSVSNQMSVAEAARYLKDRGIRAAGVCNLSGKIVGVISQSDISDKIVAENHRPSEVQVQSVCSSGIVKVTPETAITTAMQIMREKGMYHLAVENIIGEFLGMISLRDCMAVVAEQERERADMYKEYAFPRY
ncbi:MAG TPA: CBS domain-containing protein [Blastocatellia bacterium]|nr:CBS domain-containing protein [Blastocatellia bacterium]